MSPTSCLRAIREMTSAEAAAEGESAGVSHTLTVRDRRKDLEKTVSNLNLKDGGANFLAKVWAQLRAVYKESEQFEASEEANAESLVYSKWTPTRLRIPGKVHFKGLRRLILKPLRSFYSLLGCGLARKAFKGNCRHTHGRKFVDICGLGSYGVVPQIDQRLGPASQTFFAQEFGRQLF
jgi:hypothetical protein